MKNGYTMVRRLKLTPFEIRVAIEALNVKRLNQKAHGIDNRETSNLILHLLDALVWSVRYMRYSFRLKETK